MRKSVKPLPSKNGRVTRAALQNGNGKLLKSKPAA